MFPPDHTCRYLHFFAVQQRSESFPSGTSRGRLTPVGSRPLPFDVAALFVHQRQRSARSHSAARRSLNPSPPTGPRPHCLLRARRRETCGLVHVLLPRRLPTEQVWRLTCVQTIATERNVGNLASKYKQIRQRLVSTKALMVLNIS